MIEWVHAVRKNNKGKHRLKCYTGLSVSIRVYKSIFQEEKVKREHLSNHKSLN